MLQHFLFSLFGRCAKENAWLSNPLFPVVFSFHQCFFPDTSRTFAAFPISFSGMLLTTATETYEYAALISVPYMYLPLFSHWTFWKRDARVLKFFFNHIPSRIIVFGFLSMRREIGRLNFSVQLVNNLRHFLPAP